MYRTIRLTLKRIPSFNAYTKAKYSIKAAPNALFPLGTFTSLIKPALLTTGVVGGSLLISEYATQYKRDHHGRPLIDLSRFQLLPDGWIPHGKGVVYGLIAANVAIFALSHTKSVYVTRIMNEYFYNSIYNRRYSSFLLSCFNHGGLLHLGANMFVLSNFYPHVQNAVGTERALALYVSGGAISSFTSHLFRLLTRSPARSIGASGAICAFVAAFCFIYPKAQLHPIGIPALSIEAKDGLLLFAAIESSLMILFRGRLPIDFAAHLGGFAAGSAYIASLLEIRKRVRGY